MDQIVEFLISKLNYDVVDIIMKLVYIHNHKYLTGYCNCQIVSIAKEYDYLMYAYQQHQQISKPPEYVCMFILMKNREKISTNYVKTKRDVSYEII
jgi:hypothetical protein